MAEDFNDLELEEDFLTEEERYIEEFKKEDAKEAEDDSFQEHHDDMSQHLWMVSFADLMTILMIFFLSLFGYAYSGTSTQYEKAMASLQKDVASTKGKSVFENKEKEADAAMQMETFIKEKKLAEYAKVETNAQRIKISLSNPILFDSGSAELKSEAVPALKEIAHLIRSMDNPVVVEGHTDNVPMSSAKYRSNFELSAARAFSVIGYFINVEKMSPEKFSAFGYGEYKAVAPNDTDANKAKNRRIEINIIRKT
ncbi:MAG: OmpA family protein [Elusimicrobia bacterium]|nr:OmpA family protein [Elusimicrobiota bacterium]